MIAEGLSYPKAIALIAELKENGIEANITVGGISLNPKISEVQRCKSICEKAGAVVSDGNVTLLQEMTSGRFREKG